MALPAQPSHGCWSHLYCKNLAHSTAPQMRKLSPPTPIPWLRISSCHIFPTKIAKNNANPHLQTNPKLPTGSLFHLEKAGICRDQACQVEQMFSGFMSQCAMPRLCAYLTGGWAIPLPWLFQEVIPPMKPIRLLSRCLLIESMGIPVVATVSSHNQKYSQLIPLSSAMFSQPLPPINLH